MTTLDDNYIDPADVKILPTALYYGGIAGLITILIGLATSLLDLVDPADPSSISSWIVSILNWGVIIGAIYMAIKSQKDNELGGYLSMGRGIGTGMLTALILAVVSLVWTYVFFSYIDPGMIADIKEMQLVELEKQGLTEQQIEDTLPTLEKFSTPFAMGAVGALMTLLIFGLPTSIISSAILKKDRLTA